MFLTLLFTLTALAGVIPATADGQETGFTGEITDQTLVPINQLDLNETALEKYRRTPEPVAVFHAEISDESLPGPRSMAFGPRFIDVTLNPEAFCAFIVLVSLIIAAGCIWALGRWGRSGKK